MTLMPKKHIPYTTILFYILKLLCLLTILHIIVFKCALKCIKITLLNFILFCVVKAYTIKCTFIGYSRVQNGANVIPLQLTDSK